MSPLRDMSTAARPLLAERPARVAAWGLFWAGLAAAGVVAFLAFDWGMSYLFFPYEGLDPVEGLLLEHAVRVTHGRTVYPDANVEAALSCPYPPLYQVTAAALLPVTGPRLLTVRLVSALATLAVALVIAAEVWSTTRRWPLGLLWALVWLSLNGAVSGWFFRGRIDMLSVGLMAAALASWRRSERSTAAVIAAVLLTALATYTKQNGVIVGAAGLGFLALRGRWRRAAPAAAALAIALLIPALVLQRATDGRFLADVFLMRRYPPEWANVDRVKGFLSGVAVLLAMGAVWLVFALYRDRRWMASPYVLALVAFAPFGVVHHMTLGGSDNAELPALAALLLAMGTTSGAWLAGEGAGARRAVLGAAILVHALVVPVYTEKPAKADWEAGQAIDAALLAHSGPALMSRYQSYLIRAGLPVLDSIGVASDRWAAGAWDPQRMVGDLDQRRYRVILTDLRLEPPPVRAALERNYLPAGRLPLPGFARRRPPLIVLVPRGPAAGATGQTGWPGSDQP